MPETLKKNKPAFLTLMILAVHSVYIFLLYLQVPLNSDHANQILQAADILNGNVLLSGWNLTGVSFYFSEIPFYILGTLFAGIDTWAYIIAAALMVICAALAGFCLAVSGKRDQTMPTVLLYLGLTGIPTLTWLGYLRGHCAIFIYFFLILLLVQKIYADEGIRTSHWAAFAVLSACGCMSDMQLLIIGLGPLLLFCAGILVRNEPRFSWGKTARLAGTAVCGIAAGMAMDAMLMKAGHINKNGFLETRRFLDLDRAADKFLLMGKGILNVFRTDIPLSGRGFLTILTAAGILLTVLFFIVKVLGRFLRQGDGDPVSVILSISLLLMLTVCFITDIYTSEDSARYIAYFPFAAGVLICRQISFKTSRQKVMPVFLFAFVLAACFHPLQTTRVESPQDRLADFLEENGLTYGFSDFWNASHTTVASNDRVRVRSIRVRMPVLNVPAYAEMQNWFCKTEWYRPEYSNFVAFDGRNYLHVSEENISILFGEPDKILDNGEYRVFVYYHDITREIMGVK